MARRAELRLRAGKPASRPEIVRRAGFRRPALGHRTRRSRVMIAIPLCPACARAARSEGFFDAGATLLTGFREAKLG